MKGDSVEVFRQPITDGDGGTEQNERDGQWCWTARAPLGSSLANGRHFVIARSGEKRGQQGWSRQQHPTPHDAVCTMLRRGRAYPRAVYEGSIMLPA